MQSDRSTRNEPSDELQEGQTPGKKDMSRLERYWLDNWVEIIAAALLALATVASAWNAYQATRWSGIQAFRLSEAAAARTQSAQLSDKALQLTTIDVGMFVQYAAAMSDGNQLLSDFLLKRFRPEMKVAVDAWLATKPLQNPDAPPSPFAMDEYSSEAQKEAQEFSDIADRKTEDARQANYQSDNYVLITVLFTSVLFFAGISTKFESRLIRIMLLGVGLVVFLGATVALLTSPVA